MSERYECSDCEGSGYADTYATERCETCDGLGVTAIDCPNCGREAVPIQETTFVGAEGKTYCEPCGDRALARLEARRGREHGYRG